MNARSYLGPGSWRFAKVGALAALIGSGSVARAEPPLISPQQYRGEGKVTETDFSSRGYGPIEPPYKATNGSLMTMESLIPPITQQPTKEDARTRFCFANCSTRGLTSASPPLTLDRARRAQEIAIAPASAKKSVGWSFAPLGFLLGGLGVASALGEFDPTRNRVTVPGAKGPSDWGARAVAGTTFLAVGLPIVCVGVWALLSSGPVAKDDHGHYMVRDTIPIARGVGVGPQGLVF